MCEKCRLMELFDEELARFESGEAFSIARRRYALERRGISEERAMVIAHGEPFQEQPDPLAEWKALKPGRKVLEIETFTVLTVKKAYSNDIDFYGDWIGYDRLTDKRAYQLLHEGPFDAGKLQPGDWLWDEHYRQWVQFKEIASDGLIGIIGRGINYYINPYNPNLYFTPPSRGVYKYEIDSPDELDAGLHGFSDEITIIVDSDEPGGDPTGEDSFEEYMRQALIEWYDGAKVVVKKTGE